MKTYTFNLLAELRKKAWGSGQRSRVHTRVLLHLALVELTAQSRSVRSKKNRTVRRSADALEWLDKEYSLGK
jgi:hypothetical protein